MLSYEEFCKHNNMDKIDESKVIVSKPRMISENYKD